MEKAKTIFSGNVNLNRVDNREPWFSVCDNCGSVMDKVCMCQIEMDYDKDDEDLCVHAVAIAMQYVRSRAMIRALAKEIMEYSNNKNQQQ